MQGRNVAVFIIILFLAGAGILYMMYETRRIDVSLGNQVTEDRTAELSEQLNQYDYNLYWIGELPQYMEGISDHVTLLTAGQANINTLPITAGGTGFTSYDESGNVISHVEQREYAPYMMIVINTSEEIPEETWDIIEDCTVNNHVPLLLIGRNNIEAFRTHMILVWKDYDENATMYFQISRSPQDNPIDPEIVASGAHPYANALLEFFNNAFQDPSVVYVNDSESTERAYELILDPAGAGQGVG